MDKELAIKHLESFSTPGEVAEFMRLEGVKGYRVHSAYCVISNFLSAASGSSVSTVSGNSNIYSESSGLVETLYHSEAVSSFISFFDQGYYPELVAE